MINKKVILLAPFKYHYQNRLTKYIKYFEFDRIQGRKKDPETGKLTTFFDSFEWLYKTLIRKKADS